MNHLSKISILLILSLSTFAQGVCDIKTGVEKGGFTFEGPSSVCIGQTIKLKDISGGTDIRYIFGYTGQDASKLSSISSSAIPEWTFLAAGQYSILQYGKKNGKDMYYCDVVYVRENNKPDVSYEACDNTRITLTIRNSPINNFDSYKIRWSDGSTDNIPVGTVLPYSVKKTFAQSATQNVLVEGIYTIPNSCPAPQPITVKMDRGEMFPRIEQIVLNEDGTEATITLIGNPDAEYNLSSRSIDQIGAVPNGTMPKVKSGSFKVAITTPEKSQCFAVGRIGQGGCYEYSNEVCTIPFTLQPVDDDYQLSWQTPQPGKTQNTGVFTFINQVNTQIIRDENGADITTFTNVNSPYTDNTADCSKKYCYTLSSKVIISYAGYTNPNYIETATVSQKQCIDREKIRPPAITDGFVTVTPSNSVTLNFTDNSLWGLERRRFRLYRMEGALTEKIDSLTTVGPFLDASVNASEKSYCYKVSFLDKCESESELSPAFCTIFLNESTLRNLQWTSNSPFGATTIRAFEVLSYDEQTNTTTVEATKNAAESSFNPASILDKFEEEAKFQIKTISSDGKESFSNIYTIPIKAKLFLPDAFSPNSDGINDELEIKGSKSRISEFDFQVYNRWGNIIYNSTNPSEAWDGKYQNILVLPDTYSYKITATLIDGSVLNRAGKFVVLR